jgi:lysyl-tRNA synthetase, class II
MSTADTYGFWLGTFFHSEKLPAFALLVGMAVTFLCVRISTRLIRQRVNWWPSNIHHGKVHVHHMVLGLPAMFIVGVVEFAVRPGSPWVDILALCFGGAAGAVFDEFALVLHVKDVYWEREGRKSVVAVFLGTSFAAFMAVGMIPLGYSDPLPPTAVLEWSAVGAIVLNLAFVTVAFLRGRLWMGWIGLFIPVFALVAAVRLARPWSIWAHWRYDGRPQKMARAERRAADFNRRWGSRQSLLIDFFAGAPNQAAGEPLASPDDLAAVPPNPAPPVEGDTDETSHQRSGPFST